jgi:hypothetical protein
MDERGKPTPEYIRLYEEWGQGAIGIIVLGNIPCDRRYPETKGKLVVLDTLTGQWLTNVIGNAIIDPLSLWNAADAFKPVIQVAKANGSLVIAQITHAGRVCLLSFSPIMLINLLRLSKRRLTWLRSPFPPQMWHPVLSAGGPSTNLDLSRSTRSKMWFTGSRSQQKLYTMYAPTHQALMLLIWYNMLRRVPMVFSFMLRYVRFEMKSLFNISFAARLLAVSVPITQCEYSHGSLWRIKPRRPISHRVWDHRRYQSPNQRPSLYVHVNSFRALDLTMVSVVISIKINSADFSDGQP